MNWTVDGRDMIGMLVYAWVVKLVFEAIDFCETGVPLADVDELGHFAKLDGDKLSAPARD